VEADKARPHIERALRRLAGAGAAAGLRSTERGGWTFLACSVGDGPEAEARVRAALAEGVCDFILDGCQQRLLRRLVTTRYSYFTSAEQAEIVAAAERALGALERRERIRMRVLQYLERQDTLIVEGFLTFRLQDLVAEAESALDGSVDAFLLQREYQEFIQLLRHFVETLPPRHELVHAVLQPGGGFRLTDADGHPLSRDGGEGEVVGAPAPDLAPEDRVISALVTLAPRRVVLHRPAGDAALPAEAVATVREVFGSRLHLCGGCRICRDEPAPQGEGGAGGGAAGGAGRTGRDG
jgi:putative sporulation protein YtxC